MALYVYDHGYRIQTPKEALFQPGGVNSTNKSRHSHRSADTEDRLHADGEKFVIPGHTANQNNDNFTKAYQAHAEEPEKPNEERNNLNIASIMVSPVHSIPPSTRITEAWQRMQSLDISHLVITDPEERPLGLVSRHDLLEAGTNSLSAVEAVYSKQLIAGSPEALVRDVAVSFIENNINSLPIVDKDDKVVGIVCRTDLLRLLVSGPHLERWV